MIFRRFALAMGLLMAFLGSQLPEFTQQYRQRLGGALDELRAAIAQFDSEASAQALNRDQGIARLQANGDTLARQRGEAVEAMVARQDRLSRQREALATAGPVSQYAVLADGMDTSIARQALADFQPALPATAAGFIAAAVGFLLGWMATHVVALPVRHRRRAAEPRPAV